MSKAIATRATRPNREGGLAKVGLRTRHLDSAAVRTAAARIAAPRPDAPGGEPAARPLVAAALGHLPRNRCLGLALPLSMVDDQSVPPDRIVHSKAGSSHEAQGRHATFDPPAPPNLRRSSDNSIAGILSGGSQIPRDRRGTLGRRRETWRTRRLCGRRRWRGSADGASARCAGTDRAPAGATVHRQERPARWKLVWSTARAPGPASGGGRVPREAAKRGCQLACLWPGLPGASQNSAASRGRRSGRLASSLMISAPSRAHNARGDRSGFPRNTRHGPARCRRALARRWAARPSPVS